MSDFSFIVLGAPDQHAFHLLRRGIDLGYVQLDKKAAAPDVKSIFALWQANRPVYIPAVLNDELSRHATAISQSRLLYEAVLNGDEVEDLLDAAPYATSFGERFQILSSRIDEADPQEIISVDFDVMAGDQLLMEDIWMRISWLSYHEEDESFRFRFSFGMENFDDVSEDPQRQLAAAELSQCVFPESAMLTENEALITMLRDALNISTFNFVERITYFNAPNGGAQFHHDAEKGHLGVVYAQVTGETFWLALSRAELINEMMQFMRDEKNLATLATLFTDSLSSDARVFQVFCEVLKDKAQVSAMLKDPANEAMSVLLNESKPFFKRLVDAGYAFHLTAGDVILLPQASMDDCAWHSVFCVGDEAGEALSFAIKPV